MLELILAVIGLLFASGVLYQYVSNRMDKYRFPPLGEIISIENRFFHIVRTQISHKGPTVILDAGNGLTSSSWMLVQPEITKFANCISYDRAGFGWSDRSHEPNTSLNCVKDLHALLHRLNLPKPYILVGHSYGGMLSQLYAKLYPEDVAGIVLVDTYHEKQVKLVPMPSAGILNIFKIIAFLGIFRLFIQKLFPLPKTLPAQMRQRIHAEISAYTWIKTTKDVFARIDENLTHFRNMPILNKPLTVISAGLCVGPELKVQAQIDKLQKELVLRSTQGSQIIAEKSSHNIPFSQPEVIVNAVYEMIKNHAKPKTNTGSR
ncbi:MAG: alpha/beta hydrolase [Myxococcaceae bacterium]